LTAIRRTIRRFIPAISANAEREELQTPDAFKRLDFGYAPADEAEARLVAMPTDEIRAMRRTVAS
jgi:hypothetical protein